ncbi:MAG: DNA polymerase I [Lachnospiraceae bacterium]|nr:DNA polymerase I [Lachnospiraceae bacterium]
MLKKIMLIDGNSIVNRAFYGLPLLTNSEGIYTNAVYGFLNILFKLMDEENPDYLAVAFDLSAPTFRHKMFEGYKGTRKGMPDELRSQMPILKEALTLMGIKQFALEGYEADDILGTLSLKAEKEGITPVIISGDRDLLQLCDDKLMVRIPKTKGGKTEIEDYLAKDVLAKYSVTPTEFIDLKALMGDTSDNIPGVPGIGEKTATKIIMEYKNIEAAIENATEIKPKKASENLVTYAEQARLSKLLATINRNVPMEVDFNEAKAFSGISEEAYELFKKYEFKSILSRFAEPKTESVVKTDYAYITDAEQIKAFLGKIEKNTPVSYVLYEGGVSVYSEKTGGACLENKNALKIFKDFFEDDAYLKIGHDIKADIHLLDKYSIKYGKIYFDTAIAGYVLNSTRDSYNYDDIANEFLSEVYISEEELLGKGKSKKSIMDIEAERRTDFLCKNAEVYFRAAKIMEEKLSENGQEVLFREIELPLIKVLYDMEVFGIKVNKDEIISYGNELEKNIDKLTADIYSLAGEEFNINSPKQLGVILFEKLGLKGGKKTKTGYSTAADILEKLKGEHPIIENILLYRQLAKLKSTYVDGLLAVTDEKTSRIYSTFNQTITATGRLSSTEPNLQNIPVRLELGRQLRKVFIPENEDYIFLDADYSQIELRVLAHMSQDETLINAFKHDQDIHRLTASQVFNVPFDEVSTKQRSDAKAVNFGIVYGIGAFSLSQDLGITKKEADRYIEGYFAKYPKIKEYMTKTISDARENGYVSTIYNRRRAMPELNASNFMQRAFGERVAMNMPIQGSAADIIKIAMVRVSEKLKTNNLKSRLILQVHDELLIETHKDEVETVKKILKEEMENAVCLAVPMDVDVHSGRNWLEAK